MRSMFFRQHNAAFTQRLTSVAVINVPYFIY